VVAQGVAMALSIEIADQQSALTLDFKRLIQAARQVLAAAGIKSGEISIAVVSDERIHELNRQYLEHDYPTDVLSFVLDHEPAAGRLDGEVIVSADYAAREAERFGWTGDDELLLYVIHGCLHLAGHDDQTPAGQAAMRAAETQHLARFGLKHRYE
jgi:probable rRNA maturation factor